MRGQLFIMLFTFWTLLHLNFSLEYILLGLMVSGLITYLSKEIFYDVTGPIVRIPSIFQLIPYSIFLVLEIYIAAFNVMKVIIKGDDRPTLYTIKLDIEEAFIITLIANSITLTPGTLTIDKKGNELLVLSIKEEKDGRENLQKRVKHKFQKNFLKGGNRDVS